MLMLNKKMIDNTRIITDQLTTKHGVQLHIH